MKHGEGITLTLTGRCPILCLATINNMAAPGTFALEKEAHSESHVLTASRRGLTTFILVLLLFFKVRSVAFLCDFVSSSPSCFSGVMLVEMLPVEDSCALSNCCKSSSAEIIFLCEAEKCFTIALDASCGLTLCDSINLAI